MQSPASLATTLHGSLAARREDPAWRHQATSRSNVLTPQEALFRRTEAPSLFAEYDLYNAHTRMLPADTTAGVLPSSELLTGIHAYASTFYEALGTTTQNGRRGRKREHFRHDINVNECSLDETALLAFGVLLEEAGRELLGRTGEMVFTEGQKVERESGSKRPRQKDADESADIVGVMETQRPWNLRRSKRRKLGGK
ncbi:hypothetical protein TD95_000704 [Thielaviopsis punctulata]|uniref:Uncharacterized protein n=1 Tax=Thielaviopsis punctulata TaxID=72032 RepID=A0A0F4ZI90_9PEZI|nr:hypothetical protein TD95_000704 [Thielaviopsis punctulata]